MVKKQNGFTLIELLVVIAIIGLLATLAVVAFSGAQVKSRDTKRVADVRTIVATLAAVNQDYPNAIICSGTSAQSGVGTFASAIEIHNTTCATAPDLLKTYINIANIKDPRNAGTACTAGTPTAQCDYYLYTGATLSAFSMGFTTEGNAVQGIGATYYHTANQSGVVN